ncbi:acyl-CoA dehydrogenase [Nocardioides phosphati]|uniref:Acyl-CoA dehydrogenase n=1 Tax=Nocardioides phosphati TaxID=1867775 RepID=A0ABQ2NCV4_9ACTN|nr:acyl-CoA dehydrogenase family protein [Nocardioides phosphati]GGO91488.1 acyl-CoA dehydrogenase [Nocardioides phosphati]
MSQNTVSRAGGKYGLSSKEKRDPMGIAILALNKLGQSPLLDKLKMRKQAEEIIFQSTRGGFKVAAAASRTFSRKGKKGAPGTTVPKAQAKGLFDLTPTEDEQMLVDVVSEFAAEAVRPVAAEANEAAATPQDVLAATLEIGLPILGVSAELGGIAEERSAVAGTLVHEALSKGDMGIAVAALAPGAVATALSLWGTDEQQKTYLPEFTEAANVPAAALALTEPAVLFDVFQPSTTAVRQGDKLVLNGVKSFVPRGAEAELFIIGASLEGKNVLVLVEASTDGIRIEADPAMGLKAASLTKVHLRDVTVDADAILGATDGSTYTEAVRYSRLAWCALALGTGQAVLDYVVPYVKTREAFGEPIAHRQAVAFMVANIAIELQAMRLVTYKAASRIARGVDASREVALARKICADKGMQIGLDGVQLLGGHGFTKEHPVERWYRDLRAIGILEGGVLV